MTKRPFLKQLFRAHETDLTALFPEISGVFVCPICLGEFSIDDIAAERLDEGHVWPAYIREKSHSELARKEIVLLCKDCNSTAGSCGDGQMQLIEQAKDSEDAGDWQERRVQLLRGLGRPPVTLNAKVRISSADPHRIELDFTPDPRTGGWQRNDPSARQVVLNTIHTRQPVSFLVGSPHRLKPALARAGWVTSAYLLAFRSFGYRYALSNHLDPVREYIIGSFSRELTSKLDPPAEVQFQECDTCYHSDPRLCVVVPLDGKTDAFVEVSFLAYHVRLPFFGIAPLLKFYLEAKMPQLSVSAPEAIEKGMVAETEVSCTQLDGHECVWQYILGKPLPRYVDSSP